MTNLTFLPGRLTLNLNKFDLHVNIKLTFDVVIFANAQCHNVFFIDPPTPTLGNDIICEQSLGF